MTPPDDRIDDSWLRYEKMVLSKLDHDGELIERLREDLSAMRAEMSALKMKVSLIGGASGLATGVVSMMISQFGGK